MKNVWLVVLISMLLVSCNESKKQNPSASEIYPGIINNPFFTDLNESIDFAAMNEKYLTEAVEAIMVISDSALSNLISIDDNKRTFDNTMRAMDGLYADVHSVYRQVIVLAYAHPDSTIRNTALNSINELGKYFNNLDLNEGLYKAIKSYSQSKEAKKLSGYQLKFTKDRVAKFERNGFALSAEDREKLELINNDITTISNKFSENIAAHSDFLMVSEADMQGLPEDYKEARKQDDGSYKIDLSYPSYRPFLKYCKSETARKELSIKFDNVGYPANIDVLQQLLQKRLEMANLLGYETFSAYTLEKNMAKTPARVWDFENKLKEDLRAKLKLDLDELLAIKMEKGSGSGVINVWDGSYYKNLLLKEQYQLDEEEVKQYFSLDNVINGLFSISNAIFDLEFKEVENPSVWHEDVRLFEVYQDNTIKGVFYFDLHPRANKFKHAVCFDLRSRRLTDDGIQVPANGILCNFPKATPDMPSLMPHNEVLTLFHEFGHILQHLLGLNDLHLQNGFEGAFDFGEVPSQLFENWAWDYDALKLFARHYETGEVLPEELFNKMLAAKNVGSGIHYANQVFYGTYDLTLYNKYNPNSEESTTDVLRKLKNEIAAYPYVEGTHFQAGFGHLTSYASTYYSYLWSLVYAYDIFSIFEENGVLNKETGLRYRDIILAKGATENELDMVKEFLGRDPGNEAFLKALGL